MYDTYVSHVGHMCHRRQLSRMRSTHRGPLGDDISPILSDRDVILSTLIP